MVEFGVYCFCFGFGVGVCAMTGVMATVFFAQSRHEEKLLKEEIRAEQEQEDEAIEHVSREGWREHIANRFMHIE